MKRVVLALVVLAAACGGADAVNLTEEAGLAGAGSLEIEVGDDADSREWITITDADLVASLAAAVDADLPVEKRTSCSEVYELRFFRADGTVARMDYACPETPVLWGDDEFWNGGQVTVPAEFADVIRAHLSLAGR